MLLSAILTVGTVVSAYGTSTQEKISDAKAQQQQNQTSLQAARQKINELESKKGESESYLQDLNGQLEELKSNLEKLQRDYNSKQEELNRLQAELEQAKADEQEQYEAMKIRIQYMYENSDSDYFNMLFSSRSFSDFLNQAENISRMAQYDRQMLDTYRETKEAIEVKEQEVAVEKDAIAVLQQESAQQQEVVEELVQATYLQIREYQQDIQSQESKESALLQQISQQEEQINALLKQAKDEEAARKAAEKKAAEQAAREAAEKKAAEKEAAEKAAQSDKQNTSNKSESSSSQSGGSKSDTDKEETLIDTSRGTYLGRFRLTAYCTCSICCGQWAGGGTASGAAPTPGRTVAMAGVPFGTKLSINGHIYTVEDRGTAYGHVDILMASHEEALRFGSKYADVYQVN